MQCLVWFTLFGYVLTQNSCGRRNVGGIGSRILAVPSKKAEFGEFPWMIAVFRDDSGSTYECGGSLIHPEVVLTAAHCVDGGYSYKIRAGDWNIEEEDEIFPHQEQKVREVILHPKFSREEVRNDIALLILASLLELEEGVQPVCLPRHGAAVKNMKCIATGWGRNTAEEDKHQAILHKVELPTVPSNACQQSFQKTRLGYDFRLHSSYMCAGGEPGKDTCVGDGGGPLICPLASLRERYFQAGISSWGIGCGQDQLPGAYTSVPRFVNWISEKFDSYGFDKTYYTY